MAIIAAAAAALVGGAALASPQAQAASVCVRYDININGQGQAGEQCLPELPGLPPAP